MSPNDKIIRLPEVMEKVGLKKSAVYKLIKEGDFPLLPVGQYYGLAGAELLGDGVCFVDEAEKKSSSLLRKFASRITITSAGGGWSWAGLISTGTGAGGSGVAQPKLTSAQSSKVTVMLVLGIFQCSLKVCRDGHQALGMNALVIAGLVLQFGDRCRRLSQGLVVALLPCRPLGRRAVVALPVSDAGHGRQPEQSSTDQDVGVGDHFSESGKVALMSALSVPPNAAAAPQSRLAPHFMPMSPARNPMPCHVDGSPRRSSMNK